MKPILFSTPMVQAILEGQKTQTRRVIRGSNLNLLQRWDGPEDDGAHYFGWASQGDEIFAYGRLKLKPLYQPGDILWVRETWKPQDYQFIDGMWNCAIVYKAGGMEGRVYWPDGTDSIYERCGIWRPSIHMPREAARLFLRVTGVRAERVQDITHAGALAEGIPQCPGWKYELSECDCTVRAFAELWDSLNAKRGYGWDTNPWMWVYSFKRVDKPAGWPGGEDGE